MFKAPSWAPRRMEVLSRVLMQEAEGRKWNSCLRPGGNLTPDTLLLLPTAFPRWRFSELRRRGVWRQSYFDDRDSNRSSHRCVWASVTLPIVTQGSSRSC